MKTKFKIHFTSKLGQISLDVHDDVLMLLKHRNPAANFFDEDPELEQLYFAWILIRDGRFIFSELEETGDILFEVNPCK